MTWGHWIILGVLVVIWILGDAFWRLCERVAPRDEEGI